jgi:protein involved in polysaccharide export with SLBB domain
MRLFAVGLALIAATLSLTGCGGSRPISSLPSAPLDIAADYRLGPGDQVRVTVFNQPNLSGEFAVDGAGVIALPLLGPIDGGNKTSREVEQLIADGLKSSGYLVDPRVAVQVSQFRPYYILGEVGEPGAYPYSAGLTVRNAVAAAKGFTYRANTRRVYIQRAGQTFERLYDLTPATVVLPGDTIRIPERFF